MRAAKLAAIIAVVGIGVCFVVIGTPAVTTLRIAGVALLSPSRGASWEDFQEPSRGKLEKAIARNPDDWKLQLIHAERLFPGVSPKGDSDEARMRDFERFIARHPDVILARAAYLGWLFRQRWGYLHPTEAEEFAARYGRSPRLREWTKPRASEKVDLIDAAERQLSRLMQLEPNNAAWPFLFASCRFARFDDEAGLEYIGIAGREPEFSLHSKEELDTRVDAYVSLGAGRPEAIVYLQRGFLFSELSHIRDAARIAVRLADRAAQAGNAKAAAEIRTAVIDFGSLMRSKADFSMQGLVASAVVVIGYGDMGIELGWGALESEAERRAARLREIRLRQDAFQSFLRQAGLANSASRYAHGLEEAAAYGTATTEFSDSREGNEWVRAKLMGIPYAVAPIGWINLATTVVALAAVGIVAALLRKKLGPRVGNTVSGVSIIGGLVCLAVLAASAVLALRSPIGAGLPGGYAPYQWWMSLMGRPSPVLDFGWKSGLSAGVVGLGIALAVVLTTSALLLMRKPAAARRHGAMFSIVGLLLAGAFWVVAWAQFFAYPTDLDVLNAAVHIGLGVVSVGAIVAVWLVRRRMAPESPGWAVPLFATVSILAVLSVLFVPAAVTFGFEWRVLLFAAVPIAVAIAALVPWLLARKRLAKAEGPSYLGILRSGLAVCLAWILVLQFASLIWLGAWRAKAAHEIERAHATSENQAVLRIMRESEGVNESR
jgi:hypothetical protein